MELNEIKELIQLLDSTNISEFKLKTEGFSLLVRTRAYTEAMASSKAPVAMPMMPYPQPPLNALPPVQQAVTLSPAPVSATTLCAPAAPCAIATGFLNHRSKLSDVAGAPTSYSVATKSIQSVGGKIIISPHRVGSHPAFSGLSDRRQTCLDRVARLLPAHILGCRLAWRMQSGL